LLVVLAGMLADEADARADIRNYLGRNPNSWEPSGWDVNGTAIKLVIDTVGWERMKGWGNVGIGDGSVATLNATSNKDVNYSDRYIMAADVSHQPYDISRLENFDTAAAPASESIGTNESRTSETLASNPGVSGNAVNNSGIPGNNRTIGGFDSPGQANGNNTLVDDANVSSPAGEETGPANETAAKETESEETCSLSPVFTGYHPIMIGRPVDDLLYEDPLGVSISIYGRLLGLQTAAGPINIGMRCLGYGY
jgi:hypothetical protein